eukprot:m.63422 g.63422  ORF g.63422 m.63422 type:complete len:252 (+) comp11437_c0_seq2:54-809(+)
MQDPNEDTEWNDILRSKGILPPKEKTEEEKALEELVDEVVEKRVAKGGDKPLEDMELEELDEVEDDLDEDDERAFEEYKAKRLAEMRQQQMSLYGSVMEITAQEYKREVNEAGEGVWVVLLLYKPEIPVCKKLMAVFARLAEKFRTTKFIQIYSTKCIPNYPDRNLPTVFVYHNDDLKKQYVGPSIFGGEAMTVNNVEWSLGQVGAVKSKLKDPRGDGVRTALNKGSANKVGGDESDSDAVTSDDDDTDSD